MKFSMICSCGYILSTEAASRVYAIKKLKAMTTSSLLEKHMIEMHPGQERMSVRAYHAMFEKQVLLVL
jgi:predicted phosphatase